MRDIVYVAIVIAFFALCAAYIRACAGIVGPDPLVDGDAVEDTAPEVPQ